MSPGEDKLDLSLRGDIDISDHYSDRWILWMRNWVRTGNPESQMYPGLYQKQCDQDVMAHSHIISLQGYWVWKVGLLERSLPSQTVV